MTRTTPGGAHPETRYYFAASDFAYALDPWCEGAIYLLPPELFEPDYGNVQWIARQEVHPLARLVITPEDFPFRQSMCWIDFDAFSQRLNADGPLSGFPWYNDPQIATINAIPTRGQSNAEDNAVNSAP